jgi:hypothetical protein
MPPSAVIQSLWIGEALSPMEHLSLGSFLRHGHAVDLYVYDEVRNVPAGVRVRDAAEILPASRVFRYREHDSVAGFANHFRYQLLFERGGWWVDADVVCLRPFDFAEEHVFASEITYKRKRATNCVLRAPAGSPLMARAAEICTERDPASLRWGDTGPRLLTELLPLFNLHRALQPPDVFCPIPWAQWHLLADPTAPLRLPRKTYGVHLWNEMWRRGGADKHALDGERLYARLRDAARLSR